MQFGTDPDMVYKVTKAIKENTSLPVLMKLSPNVTDIVAMAEKAEEGGADGLAMINTLIGMSIDIKKRKPVLGNVIGGLSGPAIKPVAVRMIWQVAQRVKIPILGMGGIMTAEDAIEFMLAGATSVAIGTANFVNPKATMQVIDGIEKYLTEHGIKDVNEIVGAAWKG